MELGLLSGDRLIANYLIQICYCVRHSYVDFLYIDSLLDESIQVNTKQHLDLEYYEKNNFLKTCIKLWVPAIKVDAELS